MKRKTISLFLVLCLLLNLCSCGQTAEEETVLPPVEESCPVAEETALSTEEPLPDVLDAAYWQEHLPIMDGSTSLIPLEAGIRSALLGISSEEATKQVSHSTTHDSFYNLLNESVDLIFSVPLSDEQEKQAINRSIALEQVPIAKEGFVFVVNADNPVNSLTQQQLKDIYSGKITNWSEVGGNDQPIIAYQRNRDSGSQNYMTAFMGATPLMDAPTEQRPATMAGLMDVIAVNDYGAQSIGYSVYAYAADMYGNGDEIKFIAVDGVAPSKATMASGEYPLLSDNYAIFRAVEESNSPVRLLCDWMISDEGQLAIAQAGYVTQRDIGFDYGEDSAPAPYSGTGSGYLDSWDVPLWVSRAKKKGDTIRWSELYALPLSIALPDSSVLAQRKDSESYTVGITYKLDCLTNQELEDEINAFLAEAVQQADERSNDLEQLLDTLNQTYTYYRKRSDWDNSSLNQHYPSAIVSVEAKNGYIWAEVKQIFLRDAMDGYDKYYRTECKTWDLFSGEELTVEDLFLQGVDVDAYLNDFVRNASLTRIDSWGTMPLLSEDFTRLPESGWAMTPEAFYVDTDALGFVEGLRFSLEHEAAVLCSDIYRDMSGCFDESKVDLFNELAVAPYEPAYTYVNDEFFDVQLLDETVGNSEIRKAINQDFLSKVSRLTEENGEAYFKEKNIDTSEGVGGLYGWGLTEYGDRLAVFSSGGYLAAGYTTSTAWPDSMGTYLYDLQSGKELQWYDLLKEGWQENYHTYSNGNAVDWNALPPLRSFTIGNPSEEYPLTFCFYENFNENELEFRFPLSMLNLPTP
ncbi:MAG: substrate-binding domain-containing protein [Oscillospiraceae bacterium]|nr:substrate-binding domain-containing protein [Oscillospiraceae bacterium]